MNMILTVGKDDLIKESDLAICIRDTKGTNHWFPKSQISYTKKNDKMVITLPKWLADNHGEFDFEEE